MLMMRIVLATVCCRFGSSRLFIKLNFWSDFEHNVKSRFRIWLLMFGWGSQDFKFKFIRDTDVLLRFGSWCLIKILKLFDQDLCNNLWYELNHRVRCAFGNVYLFCCIESEKQGGWWQGEASSLFIGHLTAQDQHYIFRNFFRIPLFSTRTNFKALKKCVHKILAVHLHNQ